MASQRRLMRSWRSGFAPYLFGPPVPCMATGGPFSLRLAAAPPRRAAAKRPSCCLRLIREPTPPAAVHPREDPFAVQHGLSSGKGAETGRIGFGARETACKCSNFVALHNDPIGRAPWEERAADA